jgi:23S rRNA pseudouridine2605 synthase
MAEERLHKVMAAAGFGSRRACEQMIVEGRVQVDGRTVTEVGVKVDPAEVTILVDGKTLSMPSRHIYIKLNKPRGVISDIGGDTGSHKSVASLLPEDMRRVFPVGRLDLNSEGLILLTDDGELAHHLTHPSFEHPKTYYVLVDEQPSMATLEILRTGVPLPEGRSAPARVRTVEGLPAELTLAKGPTKGVWLEITLREGKKRQIRHMLAFVNHPVLRLVRFGIGPLTMGRVKPGEWTKLGGREAAQLRTFAGLAPNLGVEEEPEPEPQRAPRNNRSTRAAGAAAGAAAARGASRASRPYTPRSGSSSGERSGSNRPYTPRSGSTSSGGERSGSNSRPYTPRSGGSGGGSSSSSERPSSNRPYTPRSSGSSSERSGSSRPYTPRSSGSSSERSGSSRPYTPRSGSSSSSSERSGSNRPYTPRSGSSGSSSGGERSGSSRPYTPRSGGSSSSGGGERSGSNSRPTGGRPASGRPGGSSRPYTPRSSGSKPAGNKPGGGKPSSKTGGTSKPRREESDE